MKVSEKGERNETESRQPQKDTEASGDQNENADPRDGQITTSKSSLKKEKGKAKMNSEKSPTFANTDLGGEEEHQIDKYYLGSGSPSVMSEQKKKRRKKQEEKERWKKRYTIGGEERGRNIRVTTNELKNVGVITAGYLRGGNRRVASQTYGSCW